MISYVEHYRYYEVMLSSTTGKYLCYLGGVLFKAKTLIELRNIIDTALDDDPGL